MSSSVNIWGVRPINFKKEIQLYIHVVTFLSHIACVSELSILHEVKSTTSL